MAEKLHVLEQLAKGFELSKLIDYYKSASSKFRPQNTDVSEVLSTISDPRFESITQIGEIEYDNVNRIGFYVSPLKKDLTEKTSKKIQYDIGKKLLKANYYDAGIFVFCGANRNFRLSLIAASYLGPKREFTTFRRYTYFVSPQISNKTFIKQLSRCDFSSIDNILEAFSIEAVNKEFYTEIANRFTELTGGWRKIGSKKVEKEGCLELPGTTDETVYKEFAVRLIGRLIFCWFLKKKASQNNIPLIPENLLSTKAIKPKEGVGGYYHSILEPLFFEVLNTPVEKRKPDYGKQPWSTIPFLNGGLFTPHDDDFYELANTGFSKHINTLVVPDDWIKGLLEIFERYNFTIDENTSVDIELAVEPEMLGRIFENLLAEINPETGETARKSTGSYYTPRPIVEYMVDESLKQYLLTKTNLSEEKISSLLSYSDEQADLTETQTDSVITAIHEIKVIDPACGSGAFPMGILQKILLILQKLDPDSKKWLDKLLCGIPDPMYQKELKRKIDQPNYLHKLGIIKDCIYGVDIQPIAVEISKLRFFLSLIVDENVDDKKHNRGVEPLPNLEFKFVCANTLIGLPKQEQQHTMFEDRDSIAELKKLRDEYLQSYGKEKKTIEGNFRKVQSKMFEHSLSWSGKETQTLKLSQWNPFSHKSNPWFDPEWMFGIKDGFDIVIANPPYIVLAGEQLQNYTLTKGNNNTYVAFIEVAKKNVSSIGAIAYIIPTTWLAGNNFIDLRKALLKEKCVRQIIQLPYDMFNAYIDNLILILTGDYVKGNAVKTFRFEIKGDVRNKIDFDEFDVKDWMCDSEFVIYLSKGLTKVLKKYRNCRSKHLGDIAEVQRGTLPPKKDEKIPMTVTNPRDLLIPWFAHQVYRYIIQRCHEFQVRYDKLRENKPRRLFECEKILGRQLISRQFRLQFAYYNEPAAFKKNLYAIYNINTNFHYFYFLAILNSTLYSYIQVNLNASGQRDDYPSFSLKDYRNFLIPDLTTEKQRPFIEKVKDILAITKSNDYQTNEIKQAEVEKLEAQIDQMVYELYDLTMEEIKIVEGTI